MIEKQKNICKQFLKYNGFKNSIYNLINIYMLYTNLICKNTVRMREFYGYEINNEEIFDGYNFTIYFKDSNEYLICNTNSDIINVYISNEMPSSYGEQSKLAKIKFDFVNTITSYEDEPNANDLIPMLEFYFNTNIEDIDKKLEINKDSFKYQLDSFRIFCMDCIKSKKNHLDEVSLEFMKSVLYEYCSVYKCCDCNFIFESSEDVDDLVCPKCNSVNIVGEEC